MTIIHNEYFQKQNLDQSITLLNSLRYTILCTLRLQPPRDDCTFRVQRFSSVVLICTDKPLVYGKLTPKWNSEDPDEKEKEECIVHKIFSITRII